MVEVEAFDDELGSIVNFFLVNILDISAVASLNVASAGPSIKAP